MPSSVNSCSPLELPAAVAHIRRNIIAIEYVFADCPTTSLLDVLWSREVDFGKFCRTEDCIRVVALHLLHVQSVDCGCISSSGSYLSLSRNYGAILIRTTGDITATNQIESEKDSFRHYHAFQQATPLPTEVYAPLHRSARTFSSRCPAPPTGVRHKARYFASCRGPISPPCVQLERSLPLIKSRAKETHFGIAVPFAVPFSQNRLGLFPLNFSLDILYWLHHSYLARLLYISQSISLHSCTASDPPSTITDPLSTHVLILRTSVQQLLSLSILFANTIGLMLVSSSSCLDTPLQLVYSPPVFLPHNISLFSLETLRVSPLVSKLHPFESNIPMEVKFFCRLRTCLTSVNITDLLSAMRNQIDHLPTTLLAVLFAIHIRPSHAAYVDNTSLSLHKW
ncbi:hypothetical protein Acr_03g0017710 [Actinidia rufa]|uniref:Uncharacterized protein n=1 Tax=Actinidia rufa TaxID=165716 RepID=A0A7J0EH76_9ERIC|nr:hypothetical protein Acr_03g0017710 [Actinidia rufa]